MLQWPGQFSCQLTTIQLLSCDSDQHWGKLPWELWVSNCSLYKKTVFAFGWVCSLQSEGGAGGNRQLSIWWWVCCCSSSNVNGTQLWCLSRTLLGAWRLGNGCLLIGQHYYCHLFHRRKQIGIKMNETKILHESCANTHYRGMSQDLTPAWTEWTGPARMAVCSR